MNDTAQLRIIEAAGPIFAQKGFAGTTVREICSAAKVNQAAINYYFGSKENLYIEVFTSTYSTFSPWYEQMDSAVLDNGIPFETRFRQLMEKRTKEIFSREWSRWKVQLIFREIHDPTPSCGEKLKEYIIRDYKTIYQYLNEYFDPETLEPIRWKFIFSLFGSLFFYKNSGWVLSELLNDKMREDHFRPEQIAEFATTEFLIASAPYRRKQQNTVPQSAMGHQPPD